jgi:hypothetical protein
MHGEWGIQASTTIPGRLRTVISPRDADTSAGARQSRAILLRHT